MSHLLQKQQRKLRRLVRIRATVRGTTERPRLVVIRSLRHIEAQVIDDMTRKTVASASDKTMSAAERTGKKKTELAAIVGAKVAEAALAKGVQTVVFDRRDKKYHGRVRALAEAARAAGLTF